MTGDAADLLLACARACTEAVLRRCRATLRSGRSCSMRQTSTACCWLTSCSTPWCPTQSSTVPGQNPIVLSTARETAQRLRRVPPFEPSSTARTAYNARLALRTVDKITHWAAMLKAPEEEHLNSGTCPRGCLSFTIHWCAAPGGEVRATVDGRCRRIAPVQKLLRGGPESP
jgi:hypothetical protein